MHFRRPVVVLAVTLCTSAPLAQSRKESTRVAPGERAELNKLVDEAAAGKPAGGEAWLKWAAHFLRGADGKTYVPFTLSIDEAAGAFDSAVLYVRVAPRGDEGRSRRKEPVVPNIVGVAPGDMPVNAPDRRTGGGATPAEASVLLRSLGTKPTVSAYPYEDAYTIAPRAEGPTNTPRLRRALAVPPGEYDLYVAILERSSTRNKGSAGTDAKARTAVMKQSLTVPDLSRRGLHLSSIIVADRIETLTTPIPPAQQAQRPYAFGTAELVPALDATFRRDEVLNVAFLIYNATSSNTGKPDVRVEYLLYEESFAGDRLLGATTPQELTATTLPGAFDLRKGEQLATMQLLPLARYKPGAYRLAIRVTDRIENASAEENVRFTIQ